MENYPPIPEGAIAGLALAVLICVALPVGGYIWSRRKYGKIWKPFFIGVICFVVSQVLIRIPIVTTILPQQEWFANFTVNHYVLYGLFMAFTAGLFEEGGRYLCVRFLLKKNRSFGDSVAFGFGHGGIEAIIITGLSLGTYLVYGLMINNGTFAAAMAGVPAEQSEAIAQTLGMLTFGNAFLGGLERIIAVTLHVAMTIIVFRGFAVGKAGLHLVYAIIVHTIVDFAAVLLPMWGMSGLMMELCFAVLCVAALVLALWMKKNTDWGSKENTSDEKEISDSNNAAADTIAADSLRDE